MKIKSLKKTERINEIIKIAKDVLVRTGNHHPLVIMNEKIISVMFNDDTKEEARNKIRELVETEKPDKYYMIMEAWFNENKKDKPSYPIRPALDVDRKECLLIQEFRKDGSAKVVMIPFERKGKKIIFKRSKYMTEKKYCSLWNFYENKDKLDQEMDKSWDEAKEKYLRSEAKKMSKKFYKRFKNVKSVTELSNLFKEMKDYAIKVKSDQDKKMRKEK